MLHDKTNFSHRNNVMTRISSNGKKIVSFSDIHADIHSLIICLRDCAEAITGVLSFDELERELRSHIDININQFDRLYCKKTNGEIYDTSLGFTWNTNCNKCIVLIGDLIDGKRVVNNEICEHEYPQIELKIYAFINALMFQGGTIYKVLGNHEVMNIVQPDPMYLFEQDKTFPYTKINEKCEYRSNIFKIGQVGYNAIFYQKCYALLQIDNNIFVHGQLVGENYTYYEVMNDVLNYDVSLDIKKNFGKQCLLDRIYKTWYEFVILIIYKGVYIKNLTKWIALYHHLKGNTDNIYPMVVKDVDEIIAQNLDNPTFDLRKDKLKEYLYTIETNIRFINMTFGVKLNKLELILRLKPEFDKMKQLVFSSYLNVDENELWKRQYGLTTSIDDVNICHVIDNNLDAYNKHMPRYGTNILAERIIIGHCTQNIYTHMFKQNTSYNTVIPDENGLIERLVQPSKTAFSYYNTKNDNLIFGMTMDCPCISKPNFYKLYRVDVGTSRAFDIFRNYKTLFDDIEYLDFFEGSCTGFQFGLILDDNLPFASIEEKDIQNKESIVTHDDDVAEAITIELTKHGLIKEFLKTFLSRIPQVLEINETEIVIIRATLKNIYMNQQRSVLNELLKNHHLMKVVMDGGYNFKNY